MDNWAIAELEMQWRTRALEDELEQVRWRKLARADHSEDEGLSALRRAAAGLSEMTAGLSCRLQSRFTPGVDAAAC